MSSPNSRTRLRFDGPNDFSGAFSSDFYSPKHLLTRLSLPAVVAALVILATLALNLSRSETLARRIRTLAVLPWDCLVALTPVILIQALDAWLDPPMLPGLAPAPAPSTHAEKSERMAALLGTNKAAGVIRSLSSSFPRPSFSAGPLRAGLLNFGASKDQPPGLGNMDNSCYQNSILQGLASLDHLQPYLSSGIRGRSAKGLETARTLQDLVSRLADAENNGRTLWTPGVLKNMCSFMQQDAQEYYSKLLDEIDNEIAKAAGVTSTGPGSNGSGNSSGATDPADSVKDDDTSLHSDDSGYSSSASVASKLSANPPRNPLEGLLAQRVACVQCGHSEGLSLIPFNCLTINLGLNTPGHDLYERLDAYTDLEAIDGVVCPRCTLLKLQRLLGALADRFRRSGGADEHLARVEARLEATRAALEDETFDDETMRDRCSVTPENKVAVLKTKQAVVARPPRSLAVHVNRSVFDERTGMLFKNPAAVQFPTTLDLGPWCLGSRGAAPGSSGVGLREGGEEEEWVLDPRESMVAGEKRPSLVSGPMYELRAVITHFGHHNNGHYICYRKHASAAPPPALRDPEGGEEVPVDDVDDDVETEEEEEGEDGMTWWRLSDESVRKVSEEAVMAQGGVFMLFYDCVDSKLVRTDDGVGGKEGEGETPVGEGSLAASVDGTEMSSAETLRADGESPGPDDTGAAPRSVDGTFDADDSPDANVEDPAGGPLTRGENPEPADTVATPRSADDTSNVDDPPIRTRRIHPWNPRRIPFHQRATNEETTRLRILEYNQTP